MSFKDEYLSNKPKQCILTLNFLSCNNYTIFAQCVATELFAVKKKEEIKRKTPVPVETALFHEGGFNAHIERCRNSRKNKKDLIKRLTSTDGTWAPGHTIVKPFSFDKKNKKHKKVIRPEYKPKSRMEAYYGSVNVEAFRSTPTYTTKTKATTRRKKKMKTTKKKGLKKGVQKGVKVIKKKKRLKKKKKKTVLAANEKEKSETKSSNVDLQSYYTT